MNILQQPTLFKQSCYADGKWISSSNVINVTNPANGELIGTIPKLSEQQIIDTIEKSQQAMQKWKQETAKSRSIILRNWFNLIESNIDDLAYIMTMEQGKPLHESRGEIKYAASFIEWFAEEGKRTYGETIPQTIGTNRLTTIKQPIGVCGAVTPWNFPAAMITRKAAPAMAAGCSIIIKPASETPYTALALAELADQAGIPAGIFNVVTGESRQIGEVLTSHSLVKKFSFTGSTPVGRQLLKQCATTIKKSSMELGGNAPFIVFDDADIDKAVEGAMIAKFRNGGQTCVCVNRLYIHDAIYDQFVSKFMDKVGNLKVGNGLDEGIDIGPMITAQAITNMQSLLQDALDKGAKLAPLSISTPDHANYMSPQVLLDVDHSMNIVHEEIFGPIASIIRFSTEEEVLERANDTIYGLASYFYTNNIKRVYRMSENLEYGMIGINTGLISNEVSPFGGTKQSGLGKEGSKYGIEDYLEVKYLCLDIA